MCYNYIMNKKEFLKTIARKHSFSYNETSKIMESFVDTISEEIVKGNKVKITGFGTFYLSKRKARQIVHPRKKGEYIQLGETYKPAFKPTTKFIKKIKN